jgi:hypothetical protein
MTCKLDLRKKQGKKIKEFYKGSFRVSRLTSDTCSFLSVVHSFLIFSQLKTFVVYYFLFSKNFN